MVVTSTLVVGGLTVLMVGRRDITGVLFRAVCAFLGAVLLVSLARHDEVLALFAGPLGSLTTWAVAPSLRPPDTSSASCHDT
jgi:hypothetical protein